MIVVKKVEVDYYEGRDEVEIYHSAISCEHGYISGDRILQSPLRMVAERRIIKGLRFKKQEVIHDGFGRPIQWPPGCVATVYDQTIGWTKEVEEAIGIPLTVIHDLQKENENLRQDIINLESALLKQVKLVRQLQDIIDKIRNMPTIKRIFDFVIG